MSPKNPPATSYQLETQLIHAGEPRPRVLGAAVLPIFQSTVFEATTGADYDDLVYPRLNNLPNHEALGEKLAAIEGAEAGLVTASGMAAISTTLLTVLGKGGHLLAQQTLYGGTHSFITDDLPAFGCEVDLFDPHNPATWSELLRPNTRAVYVETISNPLLEVPDLVSIVAFCRQHGLVSIIDNTFASPVCFKPVPFGFDISVHSATKYLNGHSDLAAGAVLATRARVLEIKHKLNHLGGSLDAHACFLLHRGLKTLSLRVERQCRNALALAAFLVEQQHVRRVNYPGLPGDRFHDRAQDLLAGAGGVLSFEYGSSAEQAQAFIDHLELPVPGPSLGGVESLITRPSATSHAGLTTAQRIDAGIKENLIRFAVGIEATEDLIADMQRAMRATAPTVGVSDP